MFVKKALSNALLSALGVALALLPMHRRSVVLGKGLQDVPIAITAMNSEALREKPIENPCDLTIHAPGLVVR